MATSVQELWEKYQNFVKGNPHSVSQIETCTRILSYIIPAKFDTSNVFSELLYSASNLLVLLNDTLIRQDIKKYQVPEKQTKIKSWLAVLECLEVFLEVGADQAGGPVLHWIVVVCVQIVKTVLRYLMLKLSPSLQTTPAIKSLDRKKETKTQNQSSQGDERDIFQNDAPLAVTFTLERSGRTIRKLASTPLMGQRTWKVPERENSESAERIVPTSLSPKQLLAEKLYISRPLVHLLSMYVFGQRSWKSWLIACGIDSSSLHMMGDHKAFNKEERSELTRRTTMLLFYMLRSPFYDRFTKIRLVRLLTILARTVPGLHLIIKPLMDYLPTWQKYYFYVWNQ